MRMRMDDLPADDYRFVALDVETASGNRASICQIGLAFVGWDHSILTWSAYIDPCMDFAPFNIQLHGIGPDTVQGAPTFAEAWLQLHPILARHPLVQHSRFDEYSLDAACQEYELPPPGLQWTDSVKIARQAWPEFKGNGGHGLGNLKKALGLDFQHHDAGEDARAAAQVILRAETALGAKFSKLSAIPRALQLTLPFDS